MRYCSGCRVAENAVVFRDDYRGRWIPTSGNGPHDAAGQGLDWPSMQPISREDAQGFADCNNDYQVDSLPPYEVIELSADGKCRCCA